MNDARSEPPELGGDRLRSALSDAHPRAWRWPAVIWALGFALLHVHWAGGGRLALPSDIAIVPGSALYVAAVVAIPLLLAAAWVAWSIAGPTYRFPGLARVLLGAIAGFCLLHAVPPLVQIGLSALRAPMILSERSQYALGYEVNWLVGGVCFGLAWRAAARRVNVSDRQADRA